MVSVDRDRFDDARDEAMERASEHYHREGGAWVEHLRASVDNVVSERFADRARSHQVAIRREMMERLGYEGIGDASPPDDFDFTGGGRR